MSLARAGLAGLLLLLGWLAMVAWIGPPTGDFTNYWTAGVLWWEGADLSRLYDYRWFTGQAERLGAGDQLVGFAVLTPPSALLAAPLIGLPLEAAQRGWQAGQALLGIGLAWALARGVQRPLWVGFFAMFLLWPALRGHLVQGQMHLPAVLALALGYLAWTRDRPVLAGVGLGLAVGLKVHAWPILLLLALARQGQLVGAAAATLLLGGLVSVAALGWPVHAVWLSEIAPAAARGWFTDPWHLSLQGLDNGLRRLLVDSPGHSVAWRHAPRLAAAIPVAVEAAVVGVSVAGGLAWRQLAPAQRVRLMAACGLAAMVSGPILSSYHLVLVIPPMLWAAAAGRTLAIFALGAAMAWVPLLDPGAPGGPLWLLTALPRFWLGVALWAVILPWQLPRSAQVGRVIALAGALLLGLQTDAPPPDPATSLHTVDAPLIAADLTRSEDGTLRFSGLTAARDGRPGRGWVTFSVSTDGAVTLTDWSPDQHAWAPSPPSTAPGPGGGQLSARQGDLYLTMPDGREHRLTSHPAWDQDPVWDPQQGRIVFLSDRGAGVRALRLVAIPDTVP